MFRCPSAPSPRRVQRQELLTSRVVRQIRVWRGASGDAVTPVTLTDELDRLRRREGKGLPVSRLAGANALNPDTSSVETPVYLEERVKSQISAENDSREHKQRGRLQEPVRGGGFVLS